MKSLFISITLKFVNFCNNCFEAQVADKWEKFCLLENSFVWSPFVWSLSFLLVVTEKLEDYEATS